MDRAAPPFEAGAPGTAAPPVLAAARARLAASRAAREALVHTITGVRPEPWGDADP